MACEEGQDPKELVTPRHSKCEAIFLNSPKITLNETTEKKVMRKNMQTSLSGEVRRSVIRGDCETVNTVINNRKKLI